MLRSGDFAAAEKLTSMFSSSVTGKKVPTEIMVMNSAHLDDYGTLPSLQTKEMPSTETGSKAPVLTKTRTKVGTDKVPLTLFNNPTKNPLGLGKKPPEISNELKLIHNESKKNKSIQISIAGFAETYEVNKPKPIIETDPAKPKDKPICIISTDEKSKMAKQEKIVVKQENPEKMEKKERIETQDKDEKAEPLQKRDTEKRNEPLQKRDTVKSESVVAEEISDISDPKQLGQPTIKMSLCNSVAMLFSKDEMADLFNFFEPQQGGSHSQYDTIFNMNNTPVIESKSIITPYLSENISSNVNLKILSQVDEKLLRGKSNPDKDNSLTTVSRNKGLVANPELESKNKNNSNMNEMKPFLPEFIARDISFNLSQDDSVENSPIDVAKIKASAVVPYWIYIIPLNTKYQVIFIPLNAMSDVFCYSLDETTSIRLGRNNLNGHKKFKAFGTLVVSRNHMDMILQGDSVFCF